MTSADSILSYPTNAWEVESHSQAMHLQGVGPFIGGTVAGAAWNGQSPGFWPPGTKSCRVRHIWLAWGPNAQSSFRQYAL